MDPSLEASSITPKKATTNLTEADAAMPQLPQASSCQGTTSRTCMRVAAPDIIAVRQSTEQAAVCAEEVVAKKKLAAHKAALRQAAK